MPVESPRDAERETQVILPRPLGKLRSRRLSWSGGWRRKLKCLVVQLKGWTEIHSRALRWLYRNDSLAVREIGCGMHITARIFIDGCAAFRVEDLLQPFFRTGLLRWLLL
ncbi:MAG: hypothetical protein CV089_08385 [Nitrospira sp. WS110]|nr:hypothetical protein [Nitrospira sp. WS110]